MERIISRPHRSVCVLLTTALALYAGSTSAATKPNIILVMPDDVGFGD
jgi:hypothetical protein